MPLKETDFAYFAGIVDGEGCIRVNNAPRLHITNTDKNLIDWIKVNYGGYVWSENGSYVDNAKPRYIWELSSRKLYSLLLLIHPYLKIKRRQAELVIKYYESGIKTHISCRSKTLNLREELQRINHKGVINKLEVKYAVA